MVALCLDDGEVPNYHEDDLREAEKLVQEMDDSGELSNGFKCFIFQCFAMSTRIGDNVIMITEPHVSRKAQMCPFRRLATQKALFC